jgi:hypothetical protein
VPLPDPTQSVPLPDTIQLVPVSGLPQIRASPAFRMRTGPDYFLKCVKVNKIKKGKRSPHNIPWRHGGGRRGMALGGERSKPRPGRFTCKKALVTILHEADWATGTFRTGAKYLVPTGIRSPDCPARNESLYGLPYPGPTSWSVFGFEYEMVDK